MKKMKIVIEVVAILILLLAIIVILEKIRSFEVITIVPDDKKVIVEYSYTNWAWEFTCYGTIICDNGKIYAFEFSSEDDYVTTDNLEERSQNLIDNIITFAGNIAESDLEKIINYGETVEADYTSQGGAMDFGSSSIKLFKYDEGTIITLKSGGDNDMKNNSENVDKILKILKKYDIEVEFLNGDF